MLNWVPINNTLSLWAVNIVVNKSFPCAYVHVSYCEKLNPKLHVSFPCIRSTIIQLCTFIHIHLQYVKQCMHTCIHICILTCIYIHTHTCEGQEEKRNGGREKESKRKVQKDTVTCVTRSCVTVFWIYGYTFVHIYVCMHTYTYMYEHIYMHTHTGIYIGIHP